VNDTAEIEGDSCSLVSPALPRAPHARPGCMLGSNLESYCQVRPAASTASAGMQRSDRLPRPHMGRLRSLRAQQGFPHPQTHAKGLRPAWGASNSPASFRVDLTVSAPALGPSGIRSPTCTAKFQGHSAHLSDRGVPLRCPCRKRGKARQSLLSSMPPETVLWEPTRREAALQ
jgi:hypothetical protein